MKLWWLLFLCSTISGQIINRGIIQRDCYNGRCLPNQPGNNEVDSDFKCFREGAFLVPGTNSEFYLCKQFTEHKLEHRIMKCPEGTIFDESAEHCKFLRFSSPTDNHTEGSETMNPKPLKRQKRFLGVVSAVGGIVNAGIGIYQKLKNKKGPGVDLSRLENKLAGIEAKMDDSSLKILEKLAERKISSQITQGLLKEVLIQNQENFKITKGILHGGIAQTNENLNKIRGMILEGYESSEQNFAKLQGNLENVKDLISHEIAKAKSDIQTGFASISNSVYTAGIEPIVSTLLTSIKEFKHRQNHIMSLPEENRKDEMERNGGYIDYLESAMLEKTLNDIVHRNLAIPKSYTDFFATFILDLLCDGLQFHAGILSSIVSSNMYLASKALEERNLEDFNTYMLRVQSSLLRMELNLGYQNGIGLMKEIKDILINVEHLPFVSRIPFLTQLITERKSKLEHLETELKEFANKFTPLNVPSRISRRLDFTSSSIPLPIGPWKSGKQVSYAVQFHSKEQVSPIGEWSRPYEVYDKAHPIVYLPPANTNITRLVYRKFNDGRTPELVAMISNNEINSFRDIGRDLINAAARSNPYIAAVETKLLVDDGAEINVRLDKTMAAPFHYAAEYNNVEVLQILLNKGVDINIKSSDNMNALHFASSQGSIEALEYLLKEGADINAQTRQFGWSPLHISVSNNLLGATQILLDNKAFINIKDHMGLTPLHLSILGRGDTMKILLGTTSVDVNAKDSDGLTPLHHAARSSSAIFVKQLLQHPRIDVNALSNSHMSPLHYAAITGNAEISKLLIEHKASLTITDESGSTPLHYAAFYGNAEVSVLLIKADESLSSMKTLKGHTALDLANANNNVEVAMFLNDEKQVIQEIEEIIPRDFPETSALTNSPYPQYFIEETNCTQHIMEEIGDNSEKVCYQLDKISNYVHTVMSMVPVPVKGGREEEVFLDIKSNYNTVLKDAQTHVKLWTNGNSIETAVEQTFTLTKSFESNFNRKYNVYLTRAAEISKNTNIQNIFVKIQEEISDLENSLQETKAALAQATSPVPKRYLENRISQIGQLLEEKRQAISVDPLNAQHLEELLYFLGEVLKDGTKITNAAVNAATKVQLFQAHLNGDKQKIDSIAQHAKNNLRKIQEQIIEKNADLRVIQVRQERLQNEVQGLQREVESLYNSIYETKRQLREQRKELLRKYEKTSTIRFFASAAVGVINKFAPFIIPPQLLQLLDVRQQSIVEKWQFNLQEDQEREELISSMIANKEKTIMHLREEIINGSRNSQSIKEEMQALNKVDFYLKEVTNELPSMHGSILRVLGGLRSVDSAFSHIILRIQEIIEMGKSAKTTIEKEEALKQTFGMLTTLQCYWNGSTLFVMNLNLCSKYEY
ncbi:uncharacterized protein [Palaemon carinicauda]|uniref:uncharacterized protein n=1 Tax=Palaemon carinicauda TaxID=392227 RepID=UPI0035B60F65